MTQDIHNALAQYTRQQIREGIDRLKADLKRPSCTPSCTSSCTPDPALIESGNRFDARVSGRDGAGTPDEEELPDTDELDLEEMGEGE